MTSPTLTSIEDYQRLRRSLSTCSPEDVASHCRNLCRTDLFFLLRFGLRRADVERQWVLDRCREVQASPDGHLDLWAREHYKSTVVTFAKTIQDILASHGEDPLPEWGGVEPCFGIFSHTRPIAKGFLRQIKAEFESNRLLREWFPDVLWERPEREAPKWSEDDGIVVKRRTNPKESTVEAWGLVDGQPTSKHFGVMIYDDVVTLESVTSPEMQKKTTDRWEVSLNLSTDGGRKRYVGTRYADGDTYGTMLERGIAVPRIYPATVDGTASGTPVLVSPETIAEKRRSMSPYNFSCQMLLDPIPDETAYFSASWIEYYDELPEGVTFWGASDFAVTANGGDYTVHGVAGVDHEETIYVCDWWRSQSPPDKWVDEQIRMGREWKVLLWGEEAGQINKSVGPFLSKRMREERAYFTREQFPSHSNKPTRAQSIRGRMAMGKVKFKRNAPWVQDLVSELLRFPVGRYDDQVDVMSLFGVMLDQMWGRTVKHERPTPKGPTSGNEVLEMLAKMGQSQGRYAR